MGIPRPRPTHRSKLLHQLTQHLKFEVMSYWNERFPSEWMRGTQTIMAARTRYLASHVVHSSNRSQVSDLIVGCEERADATVRPELDRSRDSCNMCVGHRNIHGFFVICSSILKHFLPYCSDDREMASSYC